MYWMLDKSLLELKSVDHLQDGPLSALSSTHWYLNSVLCVCPKCASEYYICRGNWFVLKKIVEVITENINCILYNQGNDGSGFKIIGACAVFSLLCLTR